MFTNQNWYQTVRTVEDLVNELKRLRQDMPVKLHENQNIQSDDINITVDTKTNKNKNKNKNIGVDIVLLNRDTEDVYLTFEEGGKWEQLING